MYCKIKMLIWNYVSQIILRRTIAGRLGCDPEASTADIKACLQKVQENI